ncbi:MAG: EAL domain-containing protein [Clostridiaceae bacterium]|nr:EAL domain-containing protein [Clostridiaceae bacterium]
MTYDFILSIAYYICGCFYALFGAYIVAVNTKNKINRLFVMVTSSMAIWSIANAISNSADTAEKSAFWKCISVFGWGVFFSLLLHFALILTKTDSKLNKRIMYVLLYFPAVINIILYAPFGILGKKQYELIWTDFGWVNKLPLNAGKIWLNVYPIVFSAISIILIFRLWKKLEPHTLLKRQTTVLLISLPVTFLSGMLTDIVPDFLGKEAFPKVTTIFMVIPVTMLFVASRKYGLLLDRRRPVIVNREAFELQDSDRVRLFQMVTVVFESGSLFSFLVGYFGMKGRLIDELLLAAFLMLSAVFVRFIPLISKKRSTQNNLFLIVSVLGVAYFLATNIKTGATTIWSVYIFFLLCTVILDSGIQAYIFAAASVVIQIVFWIIYPEVPVVINGNEYVTRIILIVLSFVTVRYLTTEYASKIKGYQRFAKEQEVLERISTSFISVNSENLKEKIDEMFEMADEILGFSHAYLVEFSEDFENAIILNTRIENAEVGSFPYHPGMRVKTTTLPMARPLIDHGMPLMCEDIANVSVDEAGELRDFFMSRGVLSYFVLPIKVNEVLKGMLIVEYLDRSEIIFQENRMNLLKIITNILGDSRKKTLYEERLYDFAYFDETTKLANRNMLKQKLDQMIQYGKGSEKIAVLDIELENLRMVKDTFGHSIGEQIMIKSAAILKNLTNEHCEIARTGEGKFVIVLPAVEDTEQIEKCAKKILDSFSHPVSTETGVEALFVVVRIGISVYPDDGEDADALLKNADLASYEAKGTNEKIVFYRERLARYIAENTLLTNRLFKALQNEEFFLEFQPQISCDTGKIVGVEALLRWETDGNKRVPPDRFIPILEQTGLIYDVGLWVLKQALLEHKRLVSKELSPLRFSVNLSVVQFLGDDFVFDFSKIIEESRIDPKYIELEITESFFTDDPQDTIDKLYQLKDLGVKIAIDDFGKGYSSLNRLKMIPFDRIKIDKGIIDYIDLERKKAPITEIIILLARAFGAAITAEGVETKEQADFLKSIACDEIQGYYFSRPLSSEALEGFLVRKG